MITVDGKNFIKATILADSISEAGVRLITYEIEYPRLILSELNTHRALSKNSASSRAIPFTKMVTQLNGRPVRFGEANPGMQDKGGEFKQTVSYSDADFGYTVLNTVSPEQAWEVAKINSVRMSKAFYAAGYHKQVYNRLTEPFQVMKTIISGTEWANFFWLRDDDAADPTLRELARCMREAMEASTPTPLLAGCWHLPYVKCRRDTDRPLKEYEVGFFASGRMEYYLDDEMTQYLSLEDAIKVSCARCAAVSFRNEGYGLEKSIELYERLVGSDKKHASALEHCATPMQPDTAYDVLGSDAYVNYPCDPDTWEHGISHADRNGQLWSGNYKGWIQYRKTIVGENHV